MADHSWPASPTAGGDRVGEDTERTSRQTADVRQLEEMRAVVQECRDRFGRVDFMIANAGVAEASLLADGDSERWRTVIETNVLGLAYTVRAVLPLMRDQGHGHIVVVASLSGRITYLGESMYATSKWAAVGLGGMLRKEAAGYGVRTTLIEPGLVDTPLSRGSALGLKDLAETTPLVADDVGEAILFALTRPVHVNITELVIAPTEESY
jgi:NADP-dependent 3-hydroxy acid dehydrogenase YdfG